MNVVITDLRASSEHVSEPVLRGLTNS